MEQKAITLLDRHRYMTIATLRPDGWPHATIVGYANHDLLIYFLISRESQKFGNIRRDDRVAIAVGEPGDDVHRLEGLSIAAFASEVTDPDQRKWGWTLLTRRHPDFAEFAPPDFTRAALMRARCSIVTISDYRHGLGHADTITVATGAPVEMTAARRDDWGLTPAVPGSRS